MVGDCSSRLIEAVGEHVDAPNDRFEPVTTRFGEAPADFGHGSVETDASCQSNSSSLAIAPSPASKKSIKKQLSTRTIVASVVAIGESSVHLGAKRRRFVPDGIRFVLVDESDEFAKRILVVDQQSIDHALKLSSPRFARSSRR